MYTYSLATGRRQMLDITRQVQEALAQSGVESGIVTVYCPHTTAGITINENADPDVTHDLLLALEEICPQRPGFLHIEQNSPAHLKAMMTGASQTVPVEDGKLVLGHWQGIYFCEFDGPRTRKFHVQVLGNG